MRYLLARCLSIVGLGLFTINSYAFETEQVLVVPHCLLSENVKHEELAKVSYLRLIKTSELHDLQLARKKSDPRCQGFINVTQAWKLDTKNKNHHPSTFLKRYFAVSRPSDFVRGYKIQYQNQINPLFEKINERSMKQALQVLTQFPDRHVNSEDGVKAVQWIKKQLEEMIAKQSRQDVSVFLVPTINQAMQPSVVMKIGKNLSEPGIVMGAHIDTFDSLDESQPGADDNASGVVTLLETARILLSGDMKFKKPLYFVWYAGSEEGKLGSQSVLQYFNQNRISVDAVLQLDKTGFARGERGVGIVDDLTDAGLTAFVADLATSYLKLPVSAVRCGYACSDHVIWYQNGYRVAYPLESMDETTNPYVHRRKDTTDRLSIEHMTDFVKLSVAFAVELGGPV